MKVKVSLKDVGSADANHIPVGKVLDVVSTDATGFYVIDAAGKIYRTSASLDNADVWEVVSASHGDGEEVYTKQSPGKSMPAKSAEVPAAKPAKARAEPTDPGKKE